jgi:hypothetical protein
LPVLILKIPNNPILQSCVPPDYNCGATLAPKGQCVHSLSSHRVNDEISFFSSSNSHLCGADEDAPV